MTNTSRTYRLIETTRANGLFGATRTATVERITVQDGGLLVERHVTGTIESTPINQRSSKFWPDAQLEPAHAWRLAHGYSVVDATARRRVSDRAPATLEQLAAREYAAI